MRAADAPDAAGALYALMQGAFAAMVGRPPLRVVGGNAAGRGLCSRAERRNRPAPRERCRAGLWTAGREGALGRERQADEALDVVEDLLGAGDPLEDASPEDADEVAPPEPEELELSRVTPGVASTGPEPSPPAGAELSLDAVGRPAAFDVLFTSVEYQPEPLNTTPTFPRSLRSSPPQASQTVRASSVKDWRTSNSLPHAWHR